MDKGEQGMVTIDFTGIEWLIGMSKPADCSGGRGLVLLRVQYLNRPTAVPVDDGIRAAILLFA